VFGLSLVLCLSLVPGLRYCSIGSVGLRHHAGLRHYATGLSYLAIGLRLIRRINRLNGRFIRMVLCSKCCVTARLNAEVRTDQTNYRSEEGTQDSEDLRWIAEYAANDERKRDQIPYEDRHDTQSDNKKVSILQWFLCILQESTEKD